MERTPFRAQADRLRLALTDQQLPVSVALSYEALASLYNLSSYNRLLHSPRATLLQNRAARLRALQARLERVNLHPAPAQLAAVLDRIGDLGDVSSTDGQRHPEPSESWVRVPTLIAGNLSFTHVMEQGMISAALEEGASVILLQYTSQLKHDLETLSSHAAGETLHLLIVDDPEKHDLAALQRAADRAGVPLRVHLQRDRPDLSTGRFWCVPCFSQERDGMNFGRVRALGAVAAHHPDALVLISQHATLDRDDLQDLFPLVTGRLPRHHVMLGIHAYTLGEFVWKRRWPDLLDAFPAHIVILKSMQDDERLLWLQRHPPLGAAMHLLPAPGADGDAVLFLARDEGILKHLYSDDEIDLKDALKEAH